jgi:hypothetical protein
MIISQIVGGKKLELDISSGRHPSSYPANSGANMLLVGAGGEFAADPSTRVTVCSIIERL